MSNEGNLKWKLGGFVAAAIAILVFFIFFIGKNKNIFSSTITLVSSFEDVSGLAVGNNVRLAGIKVGTVTDVVIVNDSVVNVYVIVEKYAQKFIKADSKMAISSDGLMGDKVITILKGSPDTTLIKDGDMLASVKPFDSGKLLASLQRTAGNAEIISKNLANISVKVNSNKGIVGRLLNDSVFANHIERTFVHLEHASDGLSQNMEAAKHSFLLRKYFKKKDKEKEKEEESKEGNEDSTEDKHRRRHKDKDKDKEE